MRKDIIIILLFIANISFGQYSGLATNQAVSQNNFNYAMIGSPYLQAKGVVPNGYNSPYMLTKTQALAAFWIDPANTYLAAKPGNQIVVKRDITPYTFTPFFPHSHSIAQISSGGACGTTLADIAPMYTSTNSAPVAGVTIFYQDSTLTTTYGGSNQWWLVTYGSAYYVCQINGVGLCTALGACSTPPSKTF